MCHCPRTKVKHQIAQGTSVALTRGEASDAWLVPREEVLMPDDNRNPGNNPPGQPGRGQGNPASQPGQGGQGTGGGQGNEGQQKRNPDQGSPDSGRDDEDE